MRIGVASLGRVSEDTGGKNYILHFFRELVKLQSPHEIVLFLSEGEESLLKLQEEPEQNILPATDHPPAPSYSASLRTRGSFLRIITIRNSKRTPLHKVLAEQFRLPKYIAREKIDVMYYPGNFISLFSSVPSVVNIRSAAHFYGTKYGIHGVRRLVRSLIMPPSARKACAVITPSEDIKRDVVRFTHAPANKIEVIPHGVDLALFDGSANIQDPEGQRTLDQYGLSSGKYLLYVSALWRYKNQDKLIRAHAEIVKRGYPDLKLVIAGKGTGTDQRYLDEIYTLPTQLGTQHLVVFTGGLSQQDLRYLYAHARVFVFPSSYESFGNPIFEAWASGVPVATANVHSFPEIVADAGLLFDPTNLSDLTDKIMMLLKDDILRATMISRGRERARQFSWQACVESTLSLIERIARHPC